MMRARLWLLTACACSATQKDERPPEATVPEAADSGPWEVGLPVDPSSFDDPRRGVDTGLATSDSGGSERPVLYLRHGVAAWSMLDVKRAHVKLTAGDFTCAEVFDAGSLLAEGVHADLDPLIADDGTPQWVDTYHIRTERPAMANAIIQYAGSGSAPPEDSVMEVLSWNERTVEVQFTSSVVSSGVVALTNCGERWPWSE